MRQIVLDTETTGLEPAEGNRIIEIGCIELINFLPRDSYHTYVNPERDVPDEASIVSGLKTDFLKDKPLFAEVVDEFLNFIGQDKLVIHNAPFDLKFLNAELARLGRSPLSPDRVIDTLPMVRTMFPGSPASLDALCRRFDIDLTARSKHGALVDAKLLAEVYLELTGGRQIAFSFNGNKENFPSNFSLQAQGLNSTNSPSSINRYPPRPHQASLVELEAHTDLLSKLKNNLW
jgi:DNA polymerase-3 subunit epsilon